MTEVVAEVVAARQEYSPGSSQPEQSCRLLAGTWGPPALLGWPQGGPGWSQGWVGQDTWGCSHGLRSDPHGPCLPGLDFVPKH